MNQKNPQIIEPKNTAAPSKQEVRDKSNKELVSTGAGGRWRRTPKATRLAYLSI